MGKGEITAADGMLYVRGQKNGAVALVEATSDGYKEKGRLEQPSQTGKQDQMWAYPVVFGGKLYLRDQDNLFCYDVKAK